MRVSNEPPVIPGLIYRSFLGSGGFADVYLYESTTPVRNVAVKVLHDKAVGSRLMDRFATEANTMAALEHQNIVRVYSSGVTADGRPYIEMAYYPEQTLAQAVQKGPLPVPEVLRIAVQLASAVEAAHSVGLLHRDIKPANVLIDRFGDPALTDFGIASHLQEADDAEASVSVPWAAPEAIFSTTSLDRRCDIYSLGATLWHLLVGHSPFEVPGGDNSPKALMLRVRDLPVPPIGRSDVPASLERLIKQAMSKDPELRPPSAASFARSLGAIEEELHLRPTPFKVARPTSRAPFEPLTPTPVAEFTPHRQAHESTYSSDIRSQPSEVAQRESEDRTRLRSGSSVVASGSAPPDATRMRSSRDTRVRAHATPEASPTTLSTGDTGERPTSRTPLIIGVVCVLILAIAATVWVFFGPTVEPAPPLPTPSMGADDGLGNANTFPGPVSITGAVVDNEARFTWTYENADDSDTYLVRVQGGPEAGVKVSDSTYSMPYDGHQICISVRVERASGGYAQMEWSDKGCAP